MAAVRVMRGQGLRSNSVTDQDPTSETGPTTHNISRLYRVFDEDGTL